MRRSRGSVFFSVSRWTTFEKRFMSAIYLCPCFQDGRHPFLKLNCVHSKVHATLTDLFYFLQALIDIYNSWGDTCLIGAKLIKNMVARGDFVKENFTDTVEYHRACLKCLKNVPIVFL